MNREGGQMKREFLSILGVVFFSCFTQSAPATVLAIWNFGDSSAYYTQNPAYYNTVTMPTLALFGSGVDTNGKDGIAYLDAGGISHIAGQAAAWDDINKSGTENDAALIITLATTGFTNLSIRWDYKSELAVSYDFAYRTSADGAWTQLADNQPITPGWAEGKWYSVVIDMSGYAVLNNQPYLQFRLDDLVEGPGNDKFAIDNIEITGVPEPGSLLLLGLGGWLIRKR
jgi:hypothetical protein